MSETHSLPAYESIPDLGLYLDQTVKYVARCVEPLGVQPLTPSMVSNYVKQRYIANPVRKQYGAEQVAGLIMIAVCKTVLGMDDLARMRGAVTRSSASFGELYESWRRDLESVLDAVFADRPCPVPGDSPDQRLTHYINTAVANVLRLQSDLQSSPM